MDFTKIIPLTDIPSKDFESCDNLQAFLTKIIELVQSASDLRTQQAYLSVYMAFRDHYPSYLRNKDTQTLEKLNQLIEKSDSKIIKLRRIALAELSKVA